LWSIGIVSLAVCIKFRVQILKPCIFFQNVLYAHVRAYTGLYPLIYAYSQYLLAYTQYMLNIPEDNGISVISIFSVSASIYAVYAKYTRG
jgi:hypothetical protein